MNQVLNRRQFIKLSAGMVAGTAVLSACKPPDILQNNFQLEGWPQASQDSHWRILNRLGYGPRLEERRLMAEVGPSAFIESQLAPDTISEDSRAMLRIRRLESLHLDPADLFDVERQVASRELQQATLLRAVYSRRQLYERMVNFWSDHFNIAQLKGECAWLKTVDDREVIRPHALGKFKDLLFASAHSPAMLVYLDNQENYAGNPNENYARELLELHTLGVESGYTQQDIQALARCLTGWTVKQHFHRGHFSFNEDLHDDGPKQILGIPIPAGLKKGGGEKMLAALAEHPATAHFIATKLARRFVSDQPSPALVAQAVETFLQTEGDIKAVLRTILFSSQFQNPGPKEAKLKRPFEFMVSSLRQLNVSVTASPALLQHLQIMGQPLFNWPTPDGYPDTAPFWQGTLLARWRFALALTHHHITGCQLDQKLAVDESLSPAQIEQFVTLLLGRALAPEQVRQLLDALKEPLSPALLLAILLGSPQFQWK